MFLCRRWITKWWRVCRQLAVRIPEQVIEVPKISSPSRHCRRRVRFAEQTAEQLVEVPTIISYSSLLQRNCGAERRHSSS